MESTTTDTGVVLTENAATKIRELLERESPESQMALRIAVQPGGCSGLRYALYFDDQVGDNDKEVTLHGVKVVVDKMSVPYLGGAKIDYLDTLERSGFTIDNPSAQSTCACGDSFH